MFGHCGGYINNILACSNWRPLILNPNNNLPLQMGSCPITSVVTMMRDKHIPTDIGLGRELWQPCQQKASPNNTLRSSWSLLTAYIAEEFLKCLGLPSDQMTSVCPGKYWAAAFVNDAVVELKATNVPLISSCRPCNMKLTSLEIEPEPATLWAYDLAIWSPSSLRVELMKSWTISPSCLLRSVKSRYVIPSMSPLSKAKRWSFSTCPRVKCTSRCCWQSASLSLCLASSSSLSNASSSSKSKQ